MRRGGRRGAAGLPEVSPRAAAEQTGRQGVNSRRNAGGQPARGRRTAWKGRKNMSKPTGEAVAAKAVAAVAEGHTYAEMDCQAFVEY